MESDTSKARFVFRPARAEDIPALLEIAALSGATSWTKRMFERELGIPFSLSFVAELGKDARSSPRPLAFGIVWVVDETAQIIEFAVHPEWRRKGLGQKFLEHFMRSARERGCRKMELEFRKDNLAARRLYEKLGFVVAGERKNFYAGAFDAVLMECEI